MIHGRTIRGEGEKRAPADKTYRSYHAMKGRCLNENHSRYEDYGARGISICDRWLFGEDGLSGFECFLKDVGERPSEEHSVDRLDVNLNYEPGNCKWSTLKEQRRNTRATRWVEIYGETISFAEAVETYGQVPYATARMRVQRGWDDVKAITTPKKI